MISNTIQVSHKCPISQEKVKDLLTKTELKIFMLLSDVSRYCSKIYMTRETIALKVGCCEKTVTRSTRRLNELGLIRKYRKFIGKIEKCSYKVMSQYVGMFKKEVKKFLDAGLKFPIRILRSATSKIKNVPVVNSLNNYIYKKDNVKETYNKKDSKFLTDSNSCEYIPTKSNEILLSKQFDIHQKIKKVEERDSDMYNKGDNVLITPAIKEATEILELTQNGQATLRAYPDDVILLKLLKVMQIESDNPFQMLMDECDKHCKEHRIVICWRRSYSLKEAYGINKDDRNYTKKIKNLKGEKVTYKNKSKLQERTYNPEEERAKRINSDWYERYTEKLREGEERRRAYWRQKSLLEKHEKLEAQDNLPF